MSYSFRNRPKLSDRYRGKSGDEILNDLKSQFDEDRKMFFESSPGWNSAQSPGSFSRATHHPLDDMMSRGRRDIRSHLDDLAQRHPEFADHLRCPPWGGEMGTPHDSWGHKQRGSGSSVDDAGAAFNEPPPQDPEQSEEASPLRGRSRQNNLPQYGLRNTVDLGQQQQQQENDVDQEKGRGQRSWSAPPDNRTQNPPDSPRYVSRLDIPVNSTSTSNTATPDQGKPPVAPKHNQQSYQQSPQQPQQNAASKQNQQGSTVRHIPIFVEGRDEPILPKAAADVPTEKVFTEKVFSERTVPQSGFNYGRPSQFTSRCQQQQQPQTSRMPQHSTYGASAATPKTRTSQSPPQQQHPQQQQTSQSEDSSKVDGQSSTTFHQTKPVANDPISRVQAVQKEVDELKVKVEQFSGNSKDKEYLYLDEMLTRNLLKLDDIETEGRDDVRQARKAAIRDIQKCISDLESRVPNSEEICSDSVVEKSGEEMDLDQASTPTQPGTQNISVPSGNDQNATRENDGDMKMYEDGVPNNVNSTSTENSVTSTEVTSELSSQARSDSCVGQNDCAPSEPSPKVEAEEKTEGTSGSVQEESCLQVDEQPPQEAMDVALSSEDNLPVPTENDNQKTTSPGTNPPLNITLSSKVKSPKSSPKKGKRTT